MKMKNSLKYKDSTQVLFLIFIQQLMLDCPDDISAIVSKERHDGKAQTISLIVF